ncbi:caspase domain-containing protein [Candidatus Uabimicrobium sp. HlEnr_7]|uniref:caspase family protein n=1 Tax=Candidatus Uabimicrobium helgolandensis TaxID=3095367 RepID=UPI00355923A6
MALNNAYALLIGISEYKEKRYKLPEKGPANGVQAVAKILRNPKRCAYPKDNVKVLTNEQATTSSIREGFQWLEKKIKSTKDSIAFILFSGHGDYIKKRNGYFFMPHDYEKGCECDYEEKKESTNIIHSREFNTFVNIRLERSQRVLVFLDCCHSGGVTHGMGNDGVAPPEDFLNKLKEGEGRVVISSCKPEQKSYIFKDDKYSVFVKHLCEALHSNCGSERLGYISVLRLFTYLNENVVKDALKFEKEQRPVLKISSLDRDFPVAYAPPNPNEPISMTPSDYFDINDLAQLEAIVHTNEENLSEVIKLLEVFGEKNDLATEIKGLIKRAKELAKQKDFASYATKGQEIHNIVHKKIKISEQNIERLSEDCIDNFLTKEQAEHALMRLNIQKAHIATNNLLKEYFINIIKHLVIKGMLFQWLQELKKKDIVFVNSWINDLN